MYGVARLSPVGLDRDGLPLVPRRQAGLVVLGRDLERRFAEEDALRRLVGVDHLEDRAAGGRRVAGTLSL